MTKIKSLNDMPEFERFKKNYTEVNAMARLANRDSNIPVASARAATALIFEGATLLKNEFRLEGFANSGEEVDGIEVDQKHIDRLKDINGKIETILAEHARSIMKPE